MYGCQSKYHIDRAKQWRNTLLWTGCYVGSEIFKSLNKSAARLALLRCAWILIGMLAWLPCACQLGG
jgi:hypothetical protein